MYIPTEVRESIILPSSPMRFFRQNTIFFLWIFMKQSTVISLSCFKSENILDFGEIFFMMDVFVFLLEKIYNLET
jgi:hypothetical protein